MDLSRYRPGEEIAEGFVYRRVPNRDKHFNFNTGRPRREAYEPKPGQSLSAYLVSTEAGEPLKEPRFSKFGLSRLDIAQMRAKTGGKIRVRFTKSGSSHVDIYGSDDDIDVQEALAGLAVMVILPRR